MSVPHPGVASEQEFQALLDKAKLLLERIRVKLNELVSKINDLLGTIPGILVPDFVVEGVRAGIRKMNDLFAQLVSKVHEFINSPGFPPALFAASDRWLTDVARPAMMTADEISGDLLNIDDYWQGAAAEAYKSTVESQHSACNALVGVARKVKDCLHHAGWGIFKFWIALAVAFIAAVGGIMGATVATAAVATAPAAPLAAAAALISAIAAITSGAWAVFGELQDVRDQIDALREEVAYDVAFRGDRWPSAAVGSEWKAD